LRAIVRQDTATGHFPKDAPPQVRAADQTGPVRKEYKDRLEPLTMPEYFQLDDFVRKYRNDPRPEVQERVDKAIGRMGTSFGLGRKIPQIDVPVPMRSQ
jgi:hypothetical protein